MYQVAMYEAVRRACLVQGKTQREAAEAFKISRWMVRKILQNPSPPGYCREKEIPHRALKFYKKIIDDILKEDIQVHRKQRHTAQRLYKRLKEEHGYKGSYSAVQRYVKKRKLNTKEVFIPLSYEWGSGSYDFGQGYAYISGEQRKIHYSVIALHRSDRFFAKAYYAENSQAFLDSHVSSFKFFNGVPSHILYDNTSLAVSLKKGYQKETENFRRLKSFYLFESDFCAPGKGNEKGKVENRIKYVRQNFLTPVPQFESLDALNEHLENQCRLYNETRDPEKIQKEEEAFLPLPEDTFITAEVTARIVTKTSLIRYANNDYSVPTEYAYKKVLVHGLYDRIKIIYESQLIADHERSYGREELIAAPEHYLSLIYRKIRSINQACALQSLPPYFKKYQERLEHAYGKSGSRFYIEVLQLLHQYSFDDVSCAIKYVLKTGSSDPYAVKQALLRTKQTKGVHTEPICKSQIPPVHISSPNLHQYDALLKRA